MCINVPLFPPSWNKVNSRKLKKPLVIINSALTRVMLGVIEFSLTQLKELEPYKSTMEALTFVGVAVYTPII
jgi:hypothetical protein